MLLARAEHGDTLSGSAAVGELRAQFDNRYGNQLQINHCFNDTSELRCLASTLGMIETDGPTGTKAFVDLGK